MIPSGESGRSPRSRLWAAALSTVPFGRITPSSDWRVGVVTVRLPTLSTPEAPTMKPWGSAKKTLPPSWPDLYAFKMPFTTTGASRTMLTRLPAPFGTYRLTVLPAPSWNTENELKALPPEIVPVRMPVTLPVTPPVMVCFVAVRPSGVMTLTPGAGPWVGP